MVMLNPGRRELTYEVYDEQGNSVGCVILPRGQRVLGREQGTVLLRRAAPPAAPRVLPHVPGSNRKAS